MLSSKIKVFIVLTTALFVFANCETPPLKSNDFLSYNQSNTIDSETNIITALDANMLKKNNEMINIGIMLPLTGKHYKIGRSLLNSAQLALSKTDQENIRFHIVDTGNDEELVQNTYKLINKGIKIIIGPVFTNNCLILKDLIDEEEITVISFSNNSQLEEKNYYVFGLTLEDEINKLLNYSINRGLHKYAVVLPDNEFGQRVKKKIEEQKNKDSSIFFKYEFYDTVNPDFYRVSRTISDYETRQLNLEEKIRELEKLKTDNSLKEIKKLKKLDTYGELDFEAIIIITEKFSDLSNLNSILPYYDVDPKNIQYMGTSVWAREIALKEPGLNKSYFSSLDILSRKKFEKDYSEVFNEKSHSISSLSYDLVGLLSSLNLNEPIFNSTILNNNSGFIGINGWFRFTETGKVIRDPKIFQIRNQKFIPIN